MKVPAYRIKQPNWRPRPLMIDLLAERADISIDEARMVLDCFAEVMTEELCRSNGHIMIRDFGKLWAQRRRAPAMIGQITSAVHCGVKEITIVRWQQSPTFLSEVNRDFVPTEG